MLPVSAHLHGEASVKVKTPHKPTLSASAPSHSSEENRYHTLEKVFPSDKQWRSPVTEDTSGSNRDST